MPLRCLLFSSDDAAVRPILDVLEGLGVQAEHCKNAVDAVEKVTTHLFQIVITDWQDQPEASFLLKTARDLKAAVRPLTLAIVTEEARPLALQAGANSILLRPVRPEQVRDTMSTACQLLQAKLQGGTPPAQRPAGVATSTSGAAAAAPAPISIAPEPEKLRAGDFLQSATTTPGAQFDTESDVREPVEASENQVDPLTELEPTAAAVQETPEPISEPDAPLSGWAALQARLTKSAPASTKEAAPKAEPAFYNDATESGPPAGQSAIAVQTVGAPSIGQQSAEEPEAALFDYIEGESKSRDANSKSEAAGAFRTEPRSKAAKYGLAFAIVLAIAVTAAMPRARYGAYALYRNAIHSGARWLNPPPAALPQTVTQHDSFGQLGDEYKLPSAGSIADATTDPSQIQVVPVVDPTAKPDKHPEAVAGTTQSPATDQPQSATGTGASSDQTAVGQSAQSQGVAAQGTPAGSPASTDAPASPAPTASVTVVPPSVQAQSTQTPLHSVPVPAEPPPPVQQPATPSNPPRPSTAAHTVSAAVNAGIPASLKTLTASATPDLSGAKSPDTAMSSIEPVKLAESTVREQLAQGSDPQYPAAAKASGQSGCVVLQVLIGRDGSVQDAKFLEGSFIFARTAIDAVRQWHFKPYSLNGRPVSVQSVITLNFKPPSS